MPNTNEFRSLMRRARWDRLIGALVVLILIIVLIVTMFKGCASDNESINTNSNITPSATEAETVAPTEAYPMTVFLSPSTQEDNTYACDESVTEESAMFELAEKVKALLEADGYTVYMCGEDDGVRKKVQDGNDLQCGAYVALHTNAGGDSGAGEGTECYYNPNAEGSQALAENIYNRVAELTPTEDRGLKDGTASYFEVANYQYAGCLLEVDFHDSEEYSQWILDHQTETAKCIKDGIVAYLNSRTTAAPEEPSSEEADTLAEDAGE